MNAYTEQHLELAERVANQIAGAVANSQLHSKLQQEAEERDVLAEISRIMSTTMDIDEVYDQFADQVAKLLSFDRMVIESVDLQKGLIYDEFMTTIADGPAIGRSNRISLFSTIKKSIVKLKKLYCFAIHLRLTFSQKKPVTKFLDNILITELP